MVGYVERMENDRIAKRDYVGECDGSPSVGRPKKRWFVTVNECLRVCLNPVTEARRMVHDRSV